MRATNTNPFDRPMRWAQLTLVENDPGRFDPDFWLDYFRRTHSEGAVLSAGGYMCYYPTKIPFHYKSRFLGDSDPFGYLVAGCRRMGMSVIARSDPHAVHQDAYDAHPEWIHRKAGGEPWRHWAMPELWVTCALGPYNFGFMNEVHREIVTLYDVDGIFSNRWHGHGVCYCESCRTLFRKASGRDIPTAPHDPRDEGWKTYEVWKEDRLLELAEVWDREIGKARPGARYIPNSGGGALSRIDMKRLGQMVPILFADRQGRRGVMSPWANGQCAKEYRGGLGDKPIGAIFSVGAGEEYRWKDSTETPNELRIWAHDGIAHGMRPWFTKFCGVVPDRRWMPVVEEIYGWHHRAGDYMRNKRNLARIALVYSQQTGAFYGGPEGMPPNPRKWVEEPIDGVYQALIEARIPFEMLHEGHLDAERLAPLRTLILANVAALSDAQCDQLRAFVKRGGSLVATFETSRYDERGHKRPDLGLADLFGVRVAGEVQGPLRNSYLRVHASAGTGPLLAGLEDAERIVNAVHRLQVEPVAELAARPITFVPPYPDLPMEEVYAREEDSGHPELYLRELPGGGRVAYFPIDIDRSFAELLIYDHGKLLAGAVAWATNETPPVVIKGPGYLDVAVWTQERSMTVHIVNMTNPMAMRGSFRDLYPVGPLAVDFALPAGSRVAGVKLLTSGGTVAHRVERGRVYVTIPSVELHEVVAVDFA